MALRRELYEVGDDKVTRQRRNCPKCGPGIFLAEHSDRAHCGKCGYTEFKGGSGGDKAPKAAEAPAEEE